MHVVAKLRVEASVKRSLVHGAVRSKGLVHRCDVRGIAGVSFVIEKINKTNTTHTHTHTHTHHESSAVHVYSSRCNLSDLVELCS